MSLPSDTALPSACAQNHSTLSKVPERDIYSHITLHDNLQDWCSRIPTWYWTSEFIQILDKTPDIANRVRSLKIICVDGELGSLQYKATSSHLNGVASLLPMFARLTSFTIVGQSNAEQRCDFAWHSLHETFCQAFLRLLHSQVTKEIFICGINFFPMSLLNDCRDVRVTLECCKETQYKELASEDGERSVVPFEHLSIEDCSDTCLHNIAPWIKMHGLRSLDYDSASVEFFQPILAACSNSLTNLRLQTRGYCTSYQLSNDSEIHLNGEIVPYPITLADLPHLTQITIFAQSYFCPSDKGSWALNSPIPAISVLISTAPRALQNFSFESMFMFQQDFEQLPDPVVIWFPFIPLAAECASASISMNISPAFRFPSGYVFDIFSPFTDYKGLTPYVEKGVVVVSPSKEADGLDRAFEIELDGKCPIRTTRA